MPNPKSHKTASESSFILSKLHKPGESKDEFMERYRATMFMISLAGLIVVILWVYAPRLISQLSNSPEIVITPSTETITPTITPTPASKTKTFTPTFTPTKFVTVTPAPLPTEITDAKGATMRLVPAGEFTMGSENDNSGRQPVHQVYLDAFFIDIYEVTIAAYKRCVDAGVCSPPTNLKSSTRSIYYGKSSFDNYPVIYVDWEQSKTYCEWREAYLPTEEEWEKAARGIDGRTYPWGGILDCSYANYIGVNCNMRDTTEVGAYEKGVSPYGIYDMAGNVGEWTASCKNGDCVTRGGSWHRYLGRLETFIPNLMLLTYENFGIGFRCVNNANP